MARRLAAERFLSSGDWGREMHRMLVAAIALLAGAAAYAGDGCGKCPACRLRARGYREFARCSADGGGR